MTRRNVPAPLCSSDAVMQTLAWMRRQSFKPVPLHHASKAALNKQYVDLKYEPPGDEFWKSGQFGVGCVTGPMQGGPVDVDLDCQEAVYFATKFLPTTAAVFGRDGKPQSHYLYKVEAATFDKQAFLDPTRTSDATIVELRGDGGHQTVFPGSIHEGSGELIKWSGVPFPEVVMVTPEQLTRAVRKIAIATLIVRHVWQPGYHNEPCKHLAGMFYYLDWPLDEAVEMIEAVMEATGDTDKSRIPTVRATYRRAEKGQKVSGAGVLRKQLQNDPLVDRILDLAGSPTVNLLQEYNEKYAVVNFGGKFRIADMDVPPGEQPTFWHKDDFLNMMATDYAPVTGDSGKMTSKARIWLANPRRRTFKSIDFLPGQEESSVLNLWTGWAAQPAEGDCSGWLELLTDVVCGGNKKEANWLIHWFANIVREPMNKSLTAPVIIGVEGAGKSLLLSYFGEILGKAFVTVTHDEHIHGKFNAHLTTALVLHSEEALYAGDKRHAGIIRSLITDKTRILELKGVDARQIRNYLRLVITSNDLYSAPVKPGDRRYNIFDMGPRKAKSKLIERVLAELHGGGPAALHHHLLNMEYDGSLPRTNIKNASLLALKGVNLPPLEAWWLDTLSSGQLLPDFLAWAAKEGMDGEKLDWPETVSSVALHMAMTLRLKEISQSRSVPNTTLFGYSLNKFTNVELQKAQRHFINPMLDDWPREVKLMSERQNSIINMPPLERCRKAFEAYLGQDIEWPRIDRDAKKDGKNDAKF